MIRENNIMQSQWKILTLVGKDKVGIVAKVSQLLCRHGASLGEASMTRLAGNFSVMLMIDSLLSCEQMEQLLKPISDELQLTLHIQDMDAELFEEQLPDTRIVVYGADKMGIVSAVTHQLQTINFNIILLESSLAGTSEQPIYILTIEGNCDGEIARIKPLLQAGLEGVHIEVSPVETMIG